jgi:hypothetical protein
VVMRFTMDVVKTCADLRQDLPKVFNANNAMALKDNPNAQIPGDFETLPKEQQELVTLGFLLGLNRGIGFVMEKDYVKYATYFDDGKKDVVDGEGSKT